MIKDDEKDVLALLLERLEAENERLDRLEADNNRLAAKCIRLESEVRTLSAAEPVPSSSGATQDRGDSPARVEHDQALTRRSMLSCLAGAGAAGLGLAAGASALSAQPAEAAHTGGALQLGHADNTALGATRLTSVANPNTPFDPTLTVVNEARGDAVVGHANNDGTGVAGISSTGVGVGASGGRAPLHLDPTTTLGPPTTGFHVRGDVMLDSSGAMFVCRSAGTPGAWTRVGFNGVTPTRIADTRPGTGTPYSTGPIGPGAEREITVAGVAGVPVQADAVVMNATAVSPTAASYLTVYPSGVARPVASNLNVVSGSPPTANQVTVKLGTDGKVRVYNNSGWVHVVLDVAGFFC